MPQTVSKPEPSAFTASAEHEQAKSSVVPLKALKFAGHSEAAPLAVGTLGEATRGDGAAEDGAAGDAVAGEGAGAWRGAAACVAGLAGSEKRKLPGFALSLSDTIPLRLTPGYALRPTSGTTITVPPPSPMAPAWRAARQISERSA